MKKTVLLIISFLVFISLNSIIFSQESDSSSEAKALMDVIQNADFDTLAAIDRKVNTAASSNEIKPTDTNMIDVVYSLAVMGSENDVKAPAEEGQDLGFIREQATLALGKIGGDYVRKMLVRASSAERDKKSVWVITAYMTAFAQVGDDDQYDLLQSLSYIFNYMPNNDEGDVIKMVDSYIQCVGVLSKNTPMPILTKYGIMGSLQDLANEDPKYPIYAPSNRKAAKALMADIVGDSL